MSAISADVRGNRGRRRGDRRARRGRTLHLQNEAPIGYHQGFEEDNVSGPGVVTDPNSPDYNRHVLTGMTEVCRDWGAWMAKWENKKGHAGNYTFSLYCGYGVVDLPRMQPPPESLQSLLMGADDTSKAFRKDIRKYNSVFAFASLGANVDESLANSRSGVYTFRIQVNEALVFVFLNWSLI